MRYIETLHEGDRITSVYMCKQKSSATTKTGKSYENVIIQDKTGCMDAKIWEPNSSGIDDFDALDYIEISGDVTSFNGMLQFNIRRVRRCGEGEYDPKDFLPSSKRDVEEMYAELLGYVKKINNPYIAKLVRSFFVEDEEFVKAFKFHSAAKSVHHGFIGGLLEHTLGVTKLCDFYADTYPVINRDLILAAAMFHDMGKLREISTFPENDYTDDGNLLGHIVMGVEMIGERIRTIDGFPPKVASELKHCILAHHGEYEYGSPKKPALIEALALNFADNLDAKMETLTEIFAANEGKSEWLGFNRLLDSNIRRTSDN
ncbi:HD domain-containing protein [Falcatimonas sp. MSJ-15]|uniref:3'-5' exoribonuclease YhaM family protein n=1 Tax=Falcatimonas sp. MSJ-15 TaxID=2841515 RepID=UPI001C102945|nr:HD domain-containing protein [Falcatimonas sp. MSJ-15]